MPKIYGGLVEQRGKVVVSDVCCLFNSVDSILYLVLFFLVYKRQTYNMEQFFCVVEMASMVYEIDRCVALSAEPQIWKFHVVIWKKNGSRKSAVRALRLIFFLSFDQSYWFVTLSLLLPSWFHKLPLECVRSCDQKPYLHNETKGGICIKVEFNPQKNISLLQHGRRFFVYSSNMAAVTSCKHTLLRNLFQLNSGDVC